MTDDIKRLKLIAWVGPDEHTDELGLKRVILAGDPAGWRIVENPPVKFRRPRGMRELPEPEGGYQIEELRRFVNVSTEEDWIVVLA